MKKSVLVISTISLYRNSSVCLANVAYIRGLIENGLNVSVLMPQCDDADKDPSMELPSTVRYYIFDRTSSLEKSIAKAVKTSDLNTAPNDSLLSLLKRKSRRFLSNLKQKILKRNNKDFFVNDKVFLKNCIRNIADFNTDTYDYIISISSPVSSHYIAEKIIETGKLKYSKWYQIWEDPWYYDLYTRKTPSIFEEEERLLSKADRIIYVSPLTYHYQSGYFKQYADKMTWAFLPCYKEISYPNHVIGEKLTLGYFGEYFSHVRNIEPLSIALKDMQKLKMVVCGNGNIDMSGTTNIEVKGRVDIGTVETYQEQCDILVNISNLKGGQIPGKVYQYAGTNKAVLFVLDGTNEEKEILLNTFSKYNRFIFCDNSIDAIRKCLGDIVVKMQCCENKPVDDFSPHTVIKKILA